MTAIKPNLERLRELKAEVRQLRVEGKLTLDESRRIILEAQQAAGDLGLDGWLEPLAVVVPYEHIKAIVPIL